MAEKACVWIALSWMVATEIHEVVLIELENNCYSLYATYTTYVRERTYMITEKPCAFQRISAPTQLRAAMVEFSPAQTLPGPSSSPCHCVCIIMLITTYGSNNASTSI